MEFALSRAAKPMPFGKPLPVGRRTDALAAMRIDSARQSSEYITESAGDFADYADKLIEGDVGERDFFDAFGRLAADLSKGLQ